MDYRNISAHILLVTLRLLRIVFMYIFIVCNNFKDLNNKKIKINTRYLLVPGLIVSNTSAAVSFPDTVLRN